MKTMKKLVATLLVLTMVLALTGTVAMADCKFKVGNYVRFTKNAVCYSNHHNYNSTSTIVRKGSQALIVDTFGSKWVKLQLHPDAVTVDTLDSTTVISGWDLPDGWFKVADLRVPANPKPWEKKIGNWTISTMIHVVYSNGGVKMSLPLGTIGDPYPTRCNVKATSKVWMHKTYALTKNYGRALHNGDKVKYRHTVGLDTRLIPFYGIRYSGKNLWVSSEYSKVVK